MRRLSLISLAGLLVIAPLWNARCQAPPHNFAKWEKEVAAYERMDRTNPPPKGGLLFLGSSTIRLWSTLGRDFPGRPVLNRGVGGCEIVDDTHFADRLVFPYAPRKILFRAGGNDLWAGKSPEQVCADFKVFVATVHAKLPETDILFVSWSPTPSRWRQADKEKALNQMVEQFVRGKPHLGYIETYDMVLGPDGKPRRELFRPDMLHFNAAGYKLLTARVRPYLE